MKNSQQSPASESKDTCQPQLRDAEFLEKLREQMVKFASIQLSNVSLAEDVVQEALIAALSNINAFGGRAALKTWIFSILKNKIADALRQKRRFPDASSLLREDDEEQDFTDLFDSRGFWPAGEHPKKWPNPDEALREKQFWKIFEACLDNLPGNQAQVFMMREFIEFDSHEICETMGITMSNLNVMLYRARMRLRECLDTHWTMETNQCC